MATPISTGGSGLDITSLVSQLVAVARRPAEARINSSGSAVNAKLSAVGQVKNAMSGLQEALKKVGSGAQSPAFKASVPTASNFTASAGEGALAGEYSVEVVRLATAQKLASTGFASDARPGAGTLEIAYGGDAPLKVNVAASHGLAEIAAAVNRASGGKGVVASVVKADDGDHLVFSATATGSAGALSITASGDGGSLAALTTAPGGLQEKVAARDAVVRVDGFERVSSSNVVTDLVPGVTLNLTRAAEGTQQLLTVSSDTAGIKAALAAYATAYNSALGTLKSTSAFDAATKKASPLTGDSLVRTLQSELRGNVSQNTLALKGLGITLSKEGTMVFDAEAFDKANVADPDAVTRMFGREGTYTTGMEAVFKAALDSFEGSLTLRTDGLNKQIRSLEDQLDRLDVKMDKLTTLYTKQFTAMETMIMQLQGSASSLNDLLSTK